MVFDDDWGFVLRRTLYSGGPMPICFLLGFYDWYEDAEDDLHDLLASGATGTFEIVHVRLPGGW